MSMKNPQRKAANARKQSELGRAIGRTIKAQRTYRGLTQAEVIRSSGVSKGAYLPIESGERPADVVQLERIAKALGTTHTRIVQLAMAEVEEAKRAASHLDDTGSD
jgi:transcriptional regulator with XRE-family HTH domain